MRGPLIFLFFFFVAGAAAQNHDARKKDSLPSGKTGPKADSLPEVTIRGYRDPGSVRGALRLQQSAGSIIDIVPEEAIQRSADLTIADVTRRINGLSVTRD